MLIKIPISIEARATIWRKYLRHTEKGFMYFDAEKLRSKSSIDDLFNRTFPNAIVVNNKHEPVKPPKPPKPPKPIKSEPVSLQVVEQRKQICYQCKHCVPINGLACCEVIEQKHPGRSAIENGVKRNDVTCPIHAWPDDPLNRRNHGIRLAIRRFVGLLRWIVLGNQVCGLVRVAKTSQRNTRRTGLPDASKRKAPVN